MSQPLVFTAGATQAIDLNDTLPAGVARGGTFSVDGSGAALPVGVTLSAGGILNVSATATTGVTAGLIFAYTLS